MPYEISWAIENRVVHLRFKGSLHYSEVADATRHLGEYIERGQQPVHVCIDLREVSHYPHDVRWLVEINGRRTHSEGWNLLVVSSPRLQLFTGTVLNLIGGKFRFFTDFEAAQAFLWEQDASIHDHGNMKNL